ncbi:hypothetical protein TIFTF001_050164 [Ficus carica]|uniref:Uncharacterized protein n=1 Tax=Ficus carica TaxID=3494 RepID=A0AA88CIE3_FICCA|nr:hypothetical protein TIFTF001_050164 [Ficus carica]
MIRSKGEANASLATRESSKDPIRTPSLTSFMIVGRVATVPLYSSVSPLSLALSFELLVIKRESNEPPSYLWALEPLLVSRRLSHSHSSRFQRTDRSMNLLPLFPTGEGQVGSWEEYESCKRCHPDLEEVMGKLLVQPTEGKLLADLYSIEGSSLNQLLPYPSKVRTVSRAKDFDLRLKNKAPSPVPHKPALLRTLSPGGRTAFFFSSLPLITTRLDDAHRAGSRPAV